MFTMLIKVPLQLSSRRKKYMHISKHGKQAVSLENTRTHPEEPSKGQLTI